MRTRLIAFGVAGIALLWWLKMKNEIDFLARTLWGEARGEGEAGMKAVANVIMNRVARQSWFGAGVLGVIFQDWQFSVWNERDPNRAKVLGVTSDDPAFAKALEIAAAAVGDKLPDLTKGSTHYHTQNIKPEWSTAPGMVYTVWIGNHLFYREGT